MTIDRFDEVKAALAARRFFRVRAHPLGHSTSGEVSLHGGGRRAWGEPGALLAIIREASEGDIEGLWAGLEAAGLVRP